MLALKMLHLFSTILLQSLANYCTFQGRGKLCDSVCIFVSRNLMHHNCTRFQHGIIFLSIIFQGQRAFALQMTTPVFTLRPSLLLVIDKHLKTRFQKHFTLWQKNLMAFLRTRN